MRLAETIFKTCHFSGSVPYALIILIMLAIITYIMFSRTNYGRQILAVGDNVRGRASFPASG